jgi:hypothetical protein
MIEVKPSVAEADVVKKDLAESVLPGWVKRCGDRCGVIYNEVIAPITGIKYTAAK